MPKYLPQKRSGHLSIAICPRCHMKRYYDDLVIDPDTKNYVCKFDCVDLFDPYNMPSRKPDKIELHHPRPDDPLEIPEE